VFPSETYPQENKQKKDQINRVKTGLWLCVGIETAGRRGREEDYPHTARRKNEKKGKQFAHVYAKTLFLSGVRQVQPAKPLQKIVRGKRGKINIHSKLIALPEGGSAWRRGVLGGILRLGEETVGRKTV